MLTGVVRIERIVAVVAFVEVVDAVAVAIVGSDGCGRVGGQDGADVHVRIVRAEASVVRIERATPVVAFRQVVDAITIAVGQSQGAVRIRGNVLADRSSVVAVRTGVVRIGVVVAFLLVGLSVAVAVLRTEGTTGISSEESTNIAAGTGTTVIAGIERIASVLAFVEVVDTRSVAVRLSERAVRIRRDEGADFRGGQTVVARVGGVGTVGALIKVAYSVAVAILVRQSISRIGREYRANVHFSGKYLLTSIVRVVRVVAVGAFVGVADAVAVAILHSECAGRVGGHFGTDFGRSQSVVAGIGRVGTVGTLVEVAYAVTVAVFCSDGVGSVGGK